jgi:hypothetical protein
MGHRSARLGIAGLSSGVKKRRKTQAGGGIRGKGMCDRNKTKKVSRPPNYRKDVLVGRPNILVERLFQVAAVS